MYRNITYRLIPGTKAKAGKLSQAAGACRYVWNWALAENREAMDAWRDGKAEKPSVSFFSLGKQFIELRQDTEWLRQLPCSPIRYALKYQADAWTACFKGGGFPKFKSRMGCDSITIPENVRIWNNRLRFPKIGWMLIRRRGGNPYSDGKPVRVVCRRILGRWYATVCYEVPDVQLADNGLAVGMDMNVRQVAASTGDIIHMPDLKRLDARKRRYQRMMARRAKGSQRRSKARHWHAKTGGRISTARANWQHHVSRVFADTAGLVAVEALNTKGMTASAKGTIENPGKNVKAKAGLNREILKTGWTGLKQKLGYKVAQLVEVEPMHTSQTCPQCGTIDQANRRTQSRFECVYCGHEDNADINAALNILALGTEATGRRGALALATPMSRQKVAYSLHRS